MAYPVVQAYKYDSLDRLNEAKETSNGSQNWIQNFGYDRYGNRTSFSQTIGSTTVSTTPAIDANTNRFSSSSYTFDANGNLTVDAEGRQFTFNGDNKQTQVKDSSNNVIGTYYFDGEGKRIKKVVGSDTTIFVYSGSRLIAEYSTETLPGDPTINYTTADHLGSPRVITNALGSVTSRRDFMPFGEELAVNVGARTEGLKYGSSADNIRQKFTGYQKDEETSLDFAEARMYENRHGRFTAVDPLLASGQSSDPQTFNRYSYTMNNPVNLVDPSGMLSSSTGACGQWCPGSGAQVDGSAFHGRDASFDWVTPEITLPIIAQSQTTGGRGPITGADRTELQKSLRKLVFGLRVTIDGEIIIPRAAQNTAGYRLLSGIGKTGYSLTIVVNNQGINEAMSEREDTMRKTHPFWTDVAVNLGKPSNIVTFWDPSTVETEEVRVSANRIRSVPANATSFLAHELIHAYNYMRGLDRSNTTRFTNSSIDFKHYFTEGGVSYYESSNYEEFKTVGFLGNQASDVTENQIRAQLNLPRLAAYKHRKFWVRAN